MYAISSEASRVLMATRIPPAAGTPKCASSVAGVVGLRRQAEVRLERAPALRELRAGFSVAHGRDDDDVLAMLPVDGRRDPVRVGELERVDHAQDLVEVPAGGLRVRDRQADLLLRIEGEDGHHRVY